MVKTNSDVKSIRKKLMAAVAMLLVACIMVVSSSYAWFTLSTAPEVTGIQTSVGANGNLEIALATGTLTDASLINSKASSIKISSTTKGNGTFSRLASMARSKSVGSIS